MIEIGKKPAKMDLYLHYHRRRSTEWEARTSPGKFMQSVNISATGYGHVYVQGSCLNDKGKEHSITDVARLIDTYGEKVVNHLGGSFVIAADDRRHGIWCATDYAANFPLYYKLTDEELSVTTP
jgi:hypothetical protein